MPKHPEPRGMPPARATPTDLALAATLAILFANDEAAPEGSFDRAPRERDNRQNSKGRRQWRMSSSSNKR
jgi:hypothetical protein